MLQLCKDPENPPMYAALGFGINMFANRLGWFFNLQGPTIGLDSACSSTAMAIDIACKSLNDGSCDMVSLLHYGSMNLLRTIGDGSRLQY